MLGHREVGSDARSPKRWTKASYVDRSSARIPYHPPAKRSPVPTLLLPVSVLEATALTNFRAVTGAFFNLLQLPTQGQAPRIPRRLLCPRGRPAWLVSPRGGLPSSEPMKMMTCTVIVNWRYRCASLSSPSALRLAPASAPDVLRGWLVFGDTQLLLCPIAKLGACARPPGLGAPRTAAPALGAVGPTRGSQAASCRAGRAAGPSRLLIA